MIKKLILSILILLTIVLCDFQRAVSQTPYFKLLLFNRENPYLKVKTVAIDHNGFLLIGTSEGLYRSDGMDETIYQLPKGSKTDDVTAVAEDSEYVVWIGYRNGSLAQLRGSTLTLLNNGMPLSDMAITSILNCGKNKMAVTTAGAGVYFFSGNNYTHITEADGLNDNYVYTSAIDNSGLIWFGSDRGIARYGWNKTVFLISKYTNKDGLKDDIVRKLFCADDGNIWIGMQDSGVCYLNSNTKSFSLLKALSNWKYGQINSIVIADNDLWIATEHNGLINYNITETGTVKKYISYSGDDFSSIDELAFDHNGNLWMATNSGLFRSHANWLSFLKKFNDVRLNWIHSIVCDSKNNIWFTPDLQLYKYSPYITDTANFKKYIITNQSKHDNITCMKQDRYGYIWLGTLGEGIFRFDPQTGNKQVIKGTNHVENLSILKIAIANDTMWFATYGGVLRSKLPPPSQGNQVELKFEYLDQQPELGNFYINDIFIDSRKRVWFGTDGQGLTCYENNRFINYYRSKILPVKSIYSITEDIYGNIWFSALDHGVYKYDGKTFTNYSTAQGVREITVPTIVADKNGRVILIHRRGFDVINVKENIFEYYGTENNLSDLNPDLNSVTVDSYGNFWIGTEKGIIRYNSSFKHTHIGAHIFLSKVGVGTKDIIATPNATLKHNQNTLNFEFAGVWLTDPYRVKYQYKLEGFNKDWINTKDKSILISNLPYGEYVFRVRASLNKDFIAVDEASFSFTINKPFWKEWWFITLCGFGLVMLSYLYIVQREKRIKRFEMLEKEKVSFQLQTLKTQVNPHFLFNSFNTLISIIEHDQVVAIEYVQKLSEFFRNMVNRKDDDFITLKEEIELTDTYFFLQKKRFRENLKLEFNIDTKQRQNYCIAPLSVQLLVENAIKHNAVSHETPLAISAFIEHNMLVVKNNINLKHTKEPSVGVGLQNIRNRCKLLTGKDIIVEHTAEFFTVKIPLIHLTS